MAEEKDRFGDKLRDAERGREEDYFARRDREMIEKLRKKDPAGESAERKGSGLCPRCGNPLTQRFLQGIRADECSGCGGFWLDRGELDTLTRDIEPGESWLGRMLRSSTMR